MDQFVIYAAFVLGLASMVLHFVAPRTATKKDDAVLEAVDKAIEYLPKPTDKK